MREILFRGKHTRTGEWVEGYLFDDGIVDSKRMFIGSLVITEHTGIGDDTWEIGHDFYEVLPETVGQYTGLTDKNGKKIFEGDYWIDTDDDYTIFVAEFRNGQFCFVSYGYRGAFMEYGYDETAGGFGECDCWAMIDYNIDEIEIIGNIHDNPELLKGE